MMWSKGISPIISTILVLAITISTVSVFAGWAPDFVEDVQESTGDQGQDVLECTQGADVDVRGAVYYEDENVTIVVRNTGNLTLSNLNLEAYNDQIPINGTRISLEAGGLAAKNISVDREPNRVQARSTRCANVKDLHRDIQ